MSDPNLPTSLTILGLAFGAWAWVLAWGVGVVRKEVQDIKHAAFSTGEILTAHVTQTERRLTMLETETNWIKAGIRPNQGGEK